MESVTADLVMMKCQFETPDMDNVTPKGGLSITLNRICAGLDDFVPVWDGYTGYGIATFDVEIDANGSPDTFKWQKDDGGYTTGVAITGAAQTLSDGVTVKFINLTGHTIGDKIRLIIIPWVAMYLDSDGNRVIVRHDETTSVFETDPTFGIVTLDSLVLSQQSLADVTLGVAATELDITDTRSHLKLAGDGGGNTLATITGGSQLLIIEFKDGNVTIDHDGVGIENGIVLNGATNITPAAGDILALLKCVNSSGSPTTQWVEIGRKLAAGSVGPLTGDVTGNVTGNLVGNVTGDVEGNLNGTLSTIAKAGEIDGLGQTTGSKTSHCKLKQATATSQAIAAGATQAITGLIPAGALVLGVLVHNRAAITGGAGFTGYSVGDGSDEDKWGADLDPSNGAVSDGTMFTAGTPAHYAAATDIVLTAVGNDFTGGTIRVTVHYLEFTVV